MKPDQHTLNALGITFIERGWLSANNIVLTGDGPSALVDSGYCTHASQTVELVKHSLNGAPLDLLLNTHLHSDHCGGNAALKTEYTDLVVLIPPGDAMAVSRWDRDALTFEATGQDCPRFTYQGLLIPGQTQLLGSHEWEVHGAKGHDPHAIVLFQPNHKVLISADALWENGFGVVFPELEGRSAFIEVAETLDAIEKMAPTLVIPGHGAMFTDVKIAMLRARSRLNQFVQNPKKHQRHALKVLIKFKLLEWQKISKTDLISWLKKTPYIRRAMPDEGKIHKEAMIWMNELLHELEHNGALRIDKHMVLNS